jgi:hypothetical protein
MCTDFYDSCPTKGCRSKTACTGNPDPCEDACQSGNGCPRKQRLRRKKGNKLCQACSSGLGPILHHRRQSISRPQPLPTATETGDRPSQSGSSQQPFQDGRADHQVSSGQRLDSNPQSESSDSRQTVSDANPETEAEEFAPYRRWSRSVLDNHPLLPHEFDVLYDMYPRDELNGDNETDG